MISTVQFTYEHDTGDEIHAYEVTAEVIHTLDSKYGADADGNRCERRFTFDNVLLTRVFDCDGNQVYLEALSEFVKCGMIECAGTRFYEQ